MTLRSLPFLRNVGTSQPNNPSDDSNNRLSLDFVKYSQFGTKGLDITTNCVCISYFVCEMTSRFWKGKITDKSEIRVSGKQDRNTTSSVTPEHEDDFFCTAVPCLLILSKAFIYQLMHKRVVLTRILKFTLKQLLHVSVQSPSSGSALFELATVIVVKITN